MGLFTSDMPPIDPATFMQTPYRQRLKVLSRHWVDYGAGNPKIVMLIYLVKLIAFGCGGIAAATLTSHLDPLDPNAWWPEPIVYQKLVCWIVLLEVLGVAGAWGPLTGHFKPWTGGWRYWLRPRTIRLPPWPAKLRPTAGDERTLLDVALYAGLLGALVVTIALAGVNSASANAAIGPNKGLVAPAAVIATIALLVTLGLRDKTIFLAARGEQWMPALVFFAFFPFVDMIVAAKLLIVIIWFGAGVSKLNRHFELVIAPMVSNTPWNPFKSIKRAHYANYPDDLRPARATKLLSHVGGAVGELIPPVILLVSQNTTVTTITAIYMIAYHVFIISTFPLAAPLEWNLMFIYLTGFLFLGHQAAHGYALSNMDPALLAVTVGALMIFPILGELKPSLVSFLPGLRQYSGNWATSMWAFAPGTEDELDRHLTKGARTQIKQLTDMFDDNVAAMTLHMYLGWRSLHSQGRGLNSVMINQLGADIDAYDLREGENCAGAVLGWNFGDGHLHNSALVEAVQSRCAFAPGELIVVCAESEPIRNGRQQYLVVDAAIGIVERGSWAVHDCVEAQPWLPNGPIPTDVNYRLPGYERVAYTQPLVAG